MSIETCGEGENVQNLEKKLVCEREVGKSERRTLQMSDAVKAMVKER